MKADCTRQIQASESRSICRLILLIALSMFISPPSQADADIERHLLKAGFENIMTAVKGDTLYATFENSTHRASYRGIGIALRTMAEAAPSIRHFKTLISEYNRPQISVMAEKDAEHWKVAVSYDTDEIAQQLQVINPEQKPKGSTFGKIDITFYPIVSIDNHLLDKLAEVGIFIAPSIETTLWKGNRIIAQPIIPIFTNLFKNNPDRLMQLGVIAIRQDWLANKKWSFSTTGGSFLYNIMGLHLDACYHVNSRLNLGIRTGWAAEQVFRKSGWKTGNFNKVMCMLNADYYEPQTSLQIKTSVGRFLYGDYGIRGDVVRHFGEYAIGAYGIYTEGEKNAGFNFSIPLGTRRQQRSKKFRVRLPQYFSWEYSMLSYYRYAFEKMGREYKERPEKSFTTHYWQAAYIQQYLQRYLDGHIR